ncbi:cytokinesis protein sepA, partial [Austrofundulus limnaeus]|uniref:Cytokinesis protein sepA n=1 Tax=Austrofundulus limnaeus TaxID=52670 RepID=A0A2I4CWG9_AUSLI
MKHISYTYVNAFPQRLYAANGGRHFVTPLPKECKKERDRHRSGAGTDSSPKWKFMSVLSFLRPFVTPRETSSNMPDRFQEEHVDQNEQADQAACTEDQADSPDFGDETDADQSEIETSPEPNSSTPSPEQAGPSSAVPSAPPPPQKRLRNKPPSQQPTPFERSLMDMMTATTPPPPPPQPAPAP